MCSIEKKSEGPVDWGIEGGQGEEDTAGTEVAEDVTRPLM
jgi:hypothetical protein